MGRTLTGIAFAAAFAACGEGDVVSSADPTEPVLATVEVGLVEYSLDPSSVTFERPGTFRFHGINRGSETHALRIAGVGLDEETPLLAPGQSAMLTVPLSAGTYEMWCPVADHRALGMRATVTVHGAAPGGGGGGGGIGGGGGPY